MMLSVSHQLEPAVQSTHKEMVNIPVNVIKAAKPINEKHRYNPSVQDQRAISFIYMPDEYSEVVEHKKLFFSSKVS